MGAVGLGLGLGLGLELGLWLGIELELELELELDLMLVSARAKTGRQEKEEEERASVRYLNCLQRTIRETNCLHGFRVVGALLLRLPPMPLPRQEEFIRESAASRTAIPN